MATTSKSKRTKVSKAQALTSCGTHLKKGYVYGKGGVVYKVTPIKKTTTGKRKTGLGRTPVCVRKNLDQSTTIYTQHGGSNPCPSGGSLNRPKRGSSTKKATGKKTVRKHEGINQRTGKLKPGWRHDGHGRIVKAKAKK